LERVGLIEREREEEEERMSHVGFQDSCFNPKEKKEKQTSKEFETSHPQFVKVLKPWLHAEMELLGEGAI
jgi:hypothetical protein